MSLQTGSVDADGLARTTDGKLYVTIASGSTPILAGDGAVGAPSYSFSSDPTTGFYYQSGHGINVALNGQFKAAWFPGTFQVASDQIIGWNANTGISGTADVQLARDAANVLALKNGNSPQEQRIYAGNGGFLSSVVCVNESLAIAAAATTDSAFTVPAGAILLSASVRVTTVIPTAATFTVTTATGGTTLNTAAVSTAANSTDAGTAAGASYRSAATKIRITPNLTPATATGVVRICAYYFQVTPPTS